MEGESPTLKLTFCNLRKFTLAKSFTSIDSLKFMIAKFFNMTHSRKFMFAKRKNFENFAIRESFFIKVLDFSTNFVNVWLYWFCIENYCWGIFDKDMFFAKFNVWCLKNENFQELHFWSFAHLLYVATPKNLCMDFSVLFLFCFLRSTISEKIQLS